MFAKRPRSRPSRLNYARAPDNTRVRLSLWIIARNKARRRVVITRRITPYNARDAPLMLRESMTNPLAWQTSVECIFLEKHDYPFYLSGCPARPFVPFTRISYAREPRRLIRFANAAMSKKRENGTKRENFEEASGFCRLVDVERENAAYPTSHRENARRSPT